MKRQPLKGFPKTIKETEYQVRDWAALATALTSIATLLQKEARASATRSVALGYVVEIERITNKVLEEEHTQLSK